MTKKEKLIRTEWAETHPLLTKYYDEEWGYPVYTEQGVFERISLETLQSGLSWLTVLKRREKLRDAFSGFDPDIIASFSDEDMQKILAHEGVIKNPNKIRGIITNAKATVRLREQNTSLNDVFWSFMPERSPVAKSYKDLPTFSPESLALAKSLKKHGFVWIGPTTMYAAMGAMGVVDQHIVSSYKRGCSGLWNVDGTKVF